MAGFSFNIEASDRALAELKDSLPSEDRLAALVGAMNKTVTKAKTKAIRLVRDVIHVSAEDVRERISVSKATVGNPTCSLKVSRKPIPLGKYSPRQLKRGVSVSVRKGARRQQIPHAFIATMPSGHKGVFVRAINWRHVKVLKPIREAFITSSGEHAMRTTGKRYVREGLPIQELYGPTVVGIIAGKPGVHEELERFAQDDLDQQIKSQISRFAAKEAASRAESD